MRIDLHTHSRVSDGTTSPADVVQRAADLGLDVVGLTDHDTHAGWDEASAAARRAGIGFVPGIELSTIHERRGVHVLAYLPDPHYPPLAAEIGRILRGRDGRLGAMLEGLAGVGVRLTEAEVRRQAGDHGVIGRPHVADALVARGFAKDRSDAFDTLLSPGRAGFVVRYAPPTADLLRLVTGAGGAAVIAHPWGRGSRRVLDLETLTGLTDAGLVGLEVDHEDHSPEDRARLRAIAVELGLVVTGASDYHGAGKVDHELGCNLTAPEQLDRLLVAAAANALASGRPVPHVVAPVPFGPADVTSAQLGFEGMPRRLLQAAPSRLACYQDCPRRYRFTYLDRPPPPKGPPWAHNSFGAAVHTALANWWKAPRERRTVALISILLDDAWLTDGYRDDAQRDAARERAHEMLERYVATLDPDDEPVGVERTVALKTDRAALFGRVDRIDERPGEGLVVVDYKTGRQILTLDDARTSLALAIYAAGAERTLRRRCRRVELHHLPTGDVLTWQHSEDGLARHLRRADSIAGEIADLEERFRAGVNADESDLMYPPVVGPLCGWCDFNRSCPEGAAAASPRDPWSGLDDPVR